jgi:hypothetical protein
LAGLRIPSHHRMYRPEVLDELVAQVEDVQRFNLPQWVRMPEPGA